MSQPYSQEIARWAKLPGVQNYLYGGGMSESADTGLRERKKLDTRRALSDAALQLAFDRGGLDAVTREEIAALAGVSLRTFNNYFAGKYEALAYRMAEAGSLQQVARCTQPGWQVSKGVCFAKPAGDGNLYGWQLPQ